MLRGKPLSSTVESDLVHQCGLRPHRHRRLLTSCLTEVDHLKFPRLALLALRFSLKSRPGPGYTENGMTRKLMLCGVMIAGVLACSSLSARAESPRDGSHDFDFARGVWHTHVTKVLDPFDGGTHTRTMDGTKTVRPIWGGRAWLEGIEADGPSGHWEGASLFVYNSKAGQWSQAYIDSASGEIEAPTIGSFKDGRGELFGNDSL